MHTDREALLATFDQGCGPALLVTVSANERPCVTPVSVSVAGEALIVTLPADHPVMGYLLERPFVTLLYPLAASDDLGAPAAFVEVRCLGDVLGEQILMTPLEAWRLPHVELLFAA